MEIESDEEEEEKGGVTSIMGTEARADRGILATLNLLSTRTLLLPRLLMSTHLTSLTFFLESRGGMRIQDEVEEVVGRANDYFTSDILGDQSKDSFKLEYVTFPTV